MLEEWLTVAAIKGFFFTFPEERGGWAGGGEGGGEDRTFARDCPDEGKGKERRPLETKLLPLLEIWQFWWIYYAENCSCVEITND